MSLLIGSLTPSGVPLLTVNLTSVQTSSSESKDISALAPQRDSITLSQKALDFLHQDNPSLQAPNTNSSDTEKKTVSTKPSRLYFSFTEIRFHYT